MSDGFHVFDDPLQRNCFIIFVVSVPVCSTATALRFYASRRATGRARLEDWFAFVALAFLLAWVGIALKFGNDLNGRQVLSLSFPEVIEILRLVWVISLFFAPNQLFAKLSILLLYHRVFGVKRSYSRWIKGLGILQILWTIETTIVVIFQCTPIYKYWDISLTDGTCIAIGPYLAANESINSLIDFAMAILAVVMIRELQTSTHTKMRLAIVFLIGGFAGIVGFIKIGLAFSVSIHNQLLMGLWAVVQMACSIICCCVIAYGPILNRLNLIKRLTSSLPSYLRGSSWRGGSTGAKSYPQSAGFTDLERSRTQKGMATTDVTAGGSVRSLTGTGEEYMLDSHDAADHARGGRGQREVQLQEMV